MSRRDAARLGAGILSETLLQGTNFFKEEIMKYGPGRIKKTMTAFAKPRGALLLVCFAFLLGGSARGEDQSLKEYIYLNGRLLAIERETVPLTAEKPATGSIQNFFAEVTVDRLFPAVAPIDFRDAASAESPMRETVAATKEGDKETEYLAAHPRVGRGGIHDEFSE